MKKVVMKGKNVDDAIEAALSVLGLDRDKAKINVINEGKGGVLGVFGGEEAEVEVVEKVSSDEIARSYLQEILDRLGITAIVSNAGVEDGRILLEIKGEDSGRIIGKDGAMLDALQAVVSSMAARAVDERVGVIVDSEGYRQRRKRALERIVEESIRDVERMGVEKILPPMSAADRRLVHVIVQSYPKLRSFSVGVKPNRRVVINLADNSLGEGSAQLAKGRDDSE